MALLEMRGAGFSRDGRPIVEPIDLALEDGAHCAHACETPAAAAVLAMMAAGIVKASTGNVFIAAFDPRIQPVQAKRLVGYVPYEAIPHDFSTLSEYVGYRAALWSLPRSECIVRARCLLSKLHGMHESFAVPLAGALLSAPRLLVLDRPQPAYAQQIANAARSCAIFSTHASEEHALRFAQAGAIV